MKAILVLACVLVAFCQVQGHFFYSPDKCRGKNPSFNDLIDNILAAMDVNKDGIISFQEDVDDLLSMDKNKDGGTSRNEYVDALYDNACFSKVSGSLLFDLVDVNNDSKLTAADVDRSLFDTNGNIAIAAYKPAFLAMGKQLQELSSSCQVAGSYKRPWFYEYPGSPFSKYFG